MPIHGRTLFEVGNELKDNLNRILNTTISRRRLVSLIDRRLDRAYIHFREQGQPVAAELPSQYGRIHLDLRQYCVATQDGEDSQLLTLQTIEYRYTITIDGESEPRLRWEYVGFPEDADALWCRHHLQGPININLPARNGLSGSLNDWHLPTGWVAIEEIIRFCIVDLGVTPLRDDWDSILRESYREFRTTP